MIIRSIKGFEDNLGAHTPFIQELKNEQEDCGLELIKIVRLKSVKYTLQEVILNHSQWNYKQNWYMLYDDPVSMCVLWLYKLFIWFKILKILFCCIYHTPHKIDGAILSQTSLIWHKVDHTLFNYKDHPITLVLKLFKSKKVPRKFK